MKIVFFNWSDFGGRCIDLECNEEIKIADSFDDFIDGLVSEDMFAE